MRTLWQGLGIVAAILVAAIVALYINPPSTLINGIAERKAAELLGVPMDVRGRSSWSLRPLPSVRLVDVVIPNPPGVPGDPLLRAAAIGVDTRLTFSGLMPGLQPSTIRVESPVVRAAAAGAAGGLPGSSGAGPCKPAANVGAPLGTIVISNGSFAYGDGSEQVRLEKVFARVAQPTVDSPIDAAFETTLKGDRIDGKASLSRLQALLGCAPVRAVATLVAPRGRLELDALVEREKGPRVASKTKLDVPSIEDFAGWLGIDPRTAGRGTVAFSGDVSVEPAAAAAPAREAPGAASGWQVAIRNGTLAIGDVKAKPEHQLDKIEASATFTSLDAPVSTAFDLVYNGERIEAQAMVGQPRVLLPTPAARTETTPAVRTPVTARIATPHGRLELAGDLHPGQETAFVGRAKGSTGNLRALAVMAKLDVPVDTGLETAELESEVSASFARLRQWSLKLWNTRLAIDETKLSGALNIDRSEARPRIGGKLEADRIDLRRYLPQAAAEPSRTGNGVASASGGGTSRPEKDPFTPQFNPFATLESVSIKDELRARIDEIDGRPVRARAEPEAPSTAVWSDKRIELDALRALDLDLDLAVAELKVDQRSYGLPSVKSQLKDGRLVVTGRDITAHGGRLKADLVVDAQTPQTRLTAGIEAAGVEVEQVLGDLGIRPLLAGKAETKADFAASGRSLRDWVSSLSGNVRTTAVGSSLVGWDLRTGWQSIVARFRKGLGLAPPQPTARTPVDRLTAVIKIDKGEVVTEERIQLRGPQFSASAEGRANLPAQRVDYRGTFSTFVAPQVEIPFRASGPWSQAAPGLDRDRLDPLKALGMIFNIVFGGGGQLESVGAPSNDDVDPEVKSLMRTYVDKLEAKGGLSAPEAATLGELRRALGATP